MRILIVEDDLTNRKLLFKLLSEYGDCDLVVDGLEALDAYLLALKENSPYDLIFLDIMMPKVDGLKVLKAIRDYESQQGYLPSRRVKVIVTSALTHAQLEQKSTEIINEIFIEKPIDIQLLRETIKKLENL